MINNLIIVNRQYDYGYDSYYLARKDESVDFPSDLAMVRVLSPSAYDYTVKSVSLNVMMDVKGSLKSTSLTPSGYLSKVAKYFVVKNEISTGSSGESNYAYELQKSPVVAGTLKGYVYNNGGIVQKFTLDRGSTSLMIEDVGSPGVKATSGTYAPEGNIIHLVWSNTPTSSSISVNYEYESPVAVSVLTQTSPVSDEYDYVNLYGQTTIDTKYIEIMSTFKCKYKLPNGQDAYTNTSSRLFYTRCKSYQSLCSSTSNAYVPASIVCSERLF
jgi:hypothetical protein